LKTAKNKMRGDAHLKSNSKKDLGKKSSHPSSAPKQGTEALEKVLKQPPGKQRRKKEACKGHDLPLQTSKERSLGKKRELVMGWGSIQ